MTTTPRPITSFSPKLLGLLLKGALEPITLYAETDHRPPELFDKKLAGAKPPSGAEASGRIVTTRWHYALFTTSAAAARFREFIKLAHRLHAFRSAMAAAHHPDTDKAYSVRISVDDRTGTLRISPADTTLDTILSEVNTDEAKPTALAYDPLSKI